VAHYLTAVFSDSNRLRSSKITLSLAAPVPFPFATALSASDRSSYHHGSDQSCFKPGGRGQIQLLEQTQQTPKEGGVTGTQPGQPALEAAVQELLVFAVQLAPLLIC